jgi:hypothetical protein
LKKKEKKKIRRRRRIKKRKEENKKKKKSWPIVGPISQFSCLRQMFKGLSPFKPFGGSFLFGPLLAKFQLEEHVSRPKLI